VAKARVRLKDLNNTLRRITTEVGKLRGKGATPAAEREVRALHKKLANVQKMMAAECPDVQFRNFEIAGPAAARAAATRTRRKGTRKAR
jgi:epoxyqueuosine reductase QueG